MKILTRSNYIDCFLLINLEGTLINSNEVKMMDGAEDFINFLNLSNINYVLVTESNLIKVNYYKEKLQILNKIKNWIFKDDYVNEKPDPECYQLAISKYYNDETFIIGLESSIEGCEALEKITALIYINIQDNQNTELFINKNVFKFKNFNQL
jgi:beta-phosphoglucomutase-like phosphatase (HAD superfamily)